MEDITSSSYWNTPFRVQVNFHGQALEATLDTGASVSAVRADVSRFVPGGTFKATAWSASPLQLADGGMCCPSGLACLQFGFMGQRFYHRFAVIQNLSTPLILGMDFMMRASGVIQVPSRTVVLGDVPEAEAELEGVDVMTLNHSLLGLQDGSSWLDTNVDGAALNEGEKVKLAELLRSFAELFDGHLGHTSIVEHTVETGQV